MKSEQHAAWTRPGGALAHLAHLRGACWPATRDELIDFVARSDAPLQLLEELYALPEDGARYDSPEMVLVPTRAVQLRWHRHPHPDHGAA